MNPIKRVINRRWLFCPEKYVIQIRFCACNYQSTILRERQNYHMVKKEPNLCKYQM
jgi:hypothetical protein